MTPSYINSLQKTPLFKDTTILKHLKTETSQIIVKFLEYDTYVTPVLPNKVCLASSCLHI